MKGKTLRILIIQVKRLILIIFGFLSALLLAEGILNFFPEYNLENMVFLQDIFKGRDATFHIGRYRNSKDFGYELIPNATEEINSLGMRDKEYRIEKDSNTFRILVLGDSIIELGRWTDYLEEKLNRGRKYNKDNINYEVWNCAVAGWNLYQYWKYYKIKGKKFNPDLVLIGFCLNDLAYSMRSVFYSKKFKMFVYFVLSNDNQYLNEFLIKHINYYLFFHSRLYRLIFLKIVPYFFKKMGKQTNIDSISNSIKMLTEIKTLSKGKILAIVFPYLKPLEKYNEYEMKEYRGILKVLRESKIEYLDLAPYFNKFGEKIYQYRDNKYDKIHFNDEANRYKSEIIYEWLIEKFKQL